MAHVWIKDLTKRFGDVEAAKDVCLDIQDKEFLVLLGSPGAGEPPRRRAYGLETLNKGEIYIGDEIVKDLA